LGFGWVICRSPLPSGSTEKSPPHLLASLKYRRKTMRPFSTGADAFAVAVARRVEAIIVATATINLLIGR
jgi:hypothetical protein